MFLALGADHPLSNASSISMGDLRDQPFLLMALRCTFLNPSSRQLLESKDYHPVSHRSSPSSCRPAILGRHLSALSFVPAYMTGIHASRITYRRFEPAAQITMEAVTAHRTAEISASALNLRQLALKILGEAPKTRRRKELVPSTIPPKFRPSKPWISSVPLG